jgi:hypothetical protein
VTEELPELPEVDQVLFSTAVSLVNLAGIRLTEEEHKDAAQAKQAIDAARSLLPLCPQDKVGPVKDALSQVQMLYVKETQGRAQPAEPGASQEADDERAKARSKIWTPPGS